MTFKTRATFVLVAVLVGTAPATPTRSRHESCTRGPWRAIARSAMRGRRQRFARFAPPSPLTSASSSATRRAATRTTLCGKAAELSRLAWERFGNEADKRTGVRLLKQLQSGYPSSSLLSGVDDALARFEPVKAAPAVDRRQSSPATAALIPHASSRSRRATQSSGRAPRRRCHRPRDHAHRSPRRRPRQHRDGSGAALQAGTAREPAAHVLRSARRPSVARAPRQDLQLLRRHRS